MSRTALLQAEACGGVAAKYARLAAAYAKKSEPGSEVLFESFASAAKSHAKDAAHFALVAMSGPIWRERQSGS